MLPLPAILWHEMRTTGRPTRKPESSEAMDDAEQVRSYVKAYEWGGPTSALQLHHLRELSHLIRPGDRVVDLACGPGPLLLELAPLYPHTTFTGVDLAPTMLEHLRREVADRGLDNVEVLQEDIRTLRSLRDRSVDMVISTSALHHLPEDAGLVEVFQRCRSLLKPGGGFYFFDFGLLRSGRSRSLFVQEVARLAPPATVRDYAESLDAAFSVDWVWEVARRELPRPLHLTRSALVDILYFLQTPARTAAPRTVTTHVETIWRQLPASMRMEHVMLRRLRRTVTAE